MIIERTAAGAGWIPEFGTVWVDGLDGQEDELEDERRAEREDVSDGLIEPKRQDSGMGEIKESNKVDPKSKDTDTLEESERKAGLKPLFPDGVDGRMKH